MLLGDRAGLTPDLEQRLQGAGTYHVIAISGGNIAILVGARRSAAWRSAAFAVRSRGTTGIAVLAAYGLIAAGGASVCARHADGGVYLAIRLIDQRTSAVNALSLTATIVLLASPLAIVDVGFWLTFGATAALVTGTSMPWAQLPPRVDRSLARRSAFEYIARAALVIVMATVCVEIALAPIGARVFQRVTVAGLFLNLVAIPAMTLVQLSAMAVVACDLAHLDRAASWIAQGVHLGALSLIRSAALLDYAPWLTWRVPPPPGFVLVSYYASVAAAFIARNRSSTPRWRRAPVVVAAALLFWIVSAPGARLRAYGDGLLHLTMVDVGQGDAMLVTFPNGRTLLLDTGGVSPGGEFDIGDRVLGPALRARDLLSLDYLAVTHGDPDHIGGAQSVLRDFSPQEIWWGAPVANHPATAALRAEADAARVPWRTLQRGDRLDIGGAEVRVLHPPLPDWERQRVRNDDSLVLELRFGDVSMLLTGDIGRDIETALLPALDLRPIVVLKVPHHGSATSSSAAFIDALRPRLALIGVGRQNRYGHPVPAVLGRLRDAGAEILRTDLHGQIDVVTDGVTRVRPTDSRSPRSPRRSRRIFSSSSRDADLNTNFDTDTQHQYNTTTTNGGIDAFTRNLISPGRDRGNHLQNHRVCDRGAYAPQRRLRRGGLSQSHVHRTPAPGPLI